mmetsp:Transcript_1504/g.3831  ORF Transcript_1504/g.3831 Transcript_1504/m.3831 type:complete len:216 (-) Transcript_1504:354-1001(-)
MRDGVELSVEGRETNRTTVHIRGDNFTCVAAGGDESLNTATTAEVEHARTGFPRSEVDKVERVDANGHDRILCREQRLDAPVRSDQQLFRRGAIPSAFIVHVERVYLHRRRDELPRLAHGRAHEEAHLDQSCEWTLANSCSSLLERHCGAEEEEEEESAQRLRGALPFQRVAHFWLQPQLEVLRTRRRAAGAASLSEQKPPRQRRAVPRLTEHST